MAGRHPDLLSPLGCRVRLGRERRGYGVGGLGEAPWGATESGRAFPLLRSLESLVSRVDEVRVERFDVLVVDLAGEAEVFGAAAEPLARRLSGGSPAATAPV
jgi:hypothetical protein